MKYFIITILIFLQFVTFGQEVNPSKRMDYIKLKSGAKLYVDIIDFTANETIIVDLNGRNISIPLNQVKKIKMHKNKLAPSPLYDKTQKWTYRFNMGMSVNDNGVGYHLANSINYAINAIFEVGAGFGVENYYASRGRNVWPLFAELKSYFKEGSASPYISIRSGYGFIFPNSRFSQKDARGGVLINPSLGFEFNRIGMSWDFFLGYRTQKAYYYKINGETTSQQNIQWHRIELGIGLSF